MEEVNLLDIIQTAKEYAKWLLILTSSMFFTNLLSDIFGTNWGILDDKLDALFLDAGLNFKRTKTLIYLISELLTVSLSGSICIYLLITLNILIYFN